MAPELALDFDMPNTSSREAAMTLGGAFGLLGLLYAGISALANSEVQDNPALAHSTDVISCKRSQES